MKLLHKECCLETMMNMSSDEVDLIITSPPYNMNLRIRNGKYCSRQIVKEFSTKYEGNFSDNMPIDEYYEFHKKVIREMLRVCKNQIFYNIGIVTGSKRAIFKLIGDFNESLKDIIVWDKGYGQPSMQQGVLNRATELILVFDDHNAISRKFDNSVFERGTLNDIWRINRKRSKHNQKHGATFPEELVETILLNFSNKGDMIYDAFMGTGTVGSVAKKLGRKFCGSEITDEYYQIAVNRFSKSGGKNVI